MFARGPPATALPGARGAPSGETWGGLGMIQGARIRRFTAPLAVLAVLLIAPAADAVSLPGPRLSTFGSRPVFMSSILR